MQYYINTNVLGFEHTDGQAAWSTNRNSGPWITFATWDEFCASRDEGELNEFIYNESCLDPTKCFIFDTTIDDYVTVGEWVSE